MISQRRYCGLVPRAMSICETSRYYSNMERGPPYRPEACSKGVSTASLTGTVSCS